MFIPGIMIAAPYTQYVFNSENNNREKIEVIEKFFQRFINRGYCFQHNCGYIQNDKNNNKYIDDLIPMGLTDYFRVQQAMNLFFGCVVHCRQRGVGSDKDRNKIRKEVIMEKL
jgi:hypothetical protein